MKAALFFLLEVLVKNGPPFFFPGEEDLHLSLSLSLSPFVGGGSPAGKS